MLMRRKLKKLRRKKGGDKKALFHVSFYLNPEKHPDAEVIEKLSEMKFGHKRTSDMAKIAFLSFIMGFTHNNSAQSNAMPEKKQKKRVRFASNLISNFAEEE